MLKSKSYSIPEIYRVFKNSIGDSMNFFEKLKATWNLQTEKDGPIGIVILLSIPVIFIFIPYGFYSSITDPNLNLNISILIGIFFSIFLIYLAIIYSYLNILRKNGDMLTKIWKEN